VISSWPATLFGKLIPEFYEWGGKLIKEFALGILSKIGEPVLAVENMRGMAKYLPHLSPAEIGPLSTLDRLPFSQTFAKSIRPGPVLAAVDKMARAAALGIPLTFSEPMHVAHAMMSAPLGMPTMVSPLHPEMLPASRASGGRTEAGGSIVIHYAPNITVNGASGSPEDCVKANMSARRRCGPDGQRQAWPRKPAAVRLNSTPGTTPC